jgi:DNA helicase-2/ATP-dependent DNA helicase PcrA
VFLVGLEDGVFPHSRSISDQNELEEERRLAYVAITRAEKVLYVTHSMRRRVYGEDVAAEPSQFLNELPIELIEDLSSGPSWLSYARSSGVRKAAAGAYDIDVPLKKKPRNIYTGKTYNSSEAIAEFFSSRKDRTSKPAAVDATDDTGLSGFEKLKAASSAGKGKAASPKTESSQSFDPGSHVIHAKYGRGLVLRRDGSGDNTKLTISFPGFGQKKLIEKFANLQKA